ncbi:MAG: hypothetical protein FWE95_00665 [Planctomycetaceae bacterium]|nr:hypothetical protein [Planctomycetaceae bacterium]
MKLSKPGIVVSSYDSLESTGEVKIAKDLAQPVTGKHVLLVEDILDTGRTLKGSVQEW